MADRPHPACPPETLTIATRESRLALWQARHVQAILQTRYPHCRVDVLGMTTRGDRILDRTLSKVGGKGLFVKELEAALQEGRADLAVHSLKDVPMTLPSGLALAAILPREDPRDAVVYAPPFAQCDSLAALPSGSVVGTSSLRRKAMLLARYPHLQIAALRGNLDTRLVKLDRGEYAAIILAAAGLRRLGLSARINAVLDPDEYLPAAGQGALAIEARADRPELLKWLAPLADSATTLATAAEREVSRGLGGSCSIPLAVYGNWESETQLKLRSAVLSLDGAQILHAQASANVVELAQAIRLGQRITEALIEQGALTLIRALQIDQGDSPIPPSDD